MFDSAGFFTIDLGDLVAVGSCNNRWPLAAQLIPSSAG